MGVEVKNSFQQTAIFHQQTVQILMPVSKQTKIRFQLIFLQKNGKAQIKVL